MRGGELAECGQDEKRGTVTAEVENRAEMTGRERAGGGGRGKERGGDRVSAVQ